MHITLCINLSTTLGHSDTAVQSVLHILQQSFGEFAQSATAYTVNNKDKHF